MPTFEITTKQTMNVNGEYVCKGLSVQISSLSSNPFNDVDKIDKAFKRVHGLDLKSTGHLNVGFLTYSIK
ncbi:DUF6140 family protein [Lacinutrix sp. 5H-3-7-4]|uniref:DUF6140 family protein n=1 Tax=Lacinutrix sp. (strain 5H-3-7-4) TaxID=983544 RepID=UPI00020A3D66|nr:DUF6140 family protein [Lacinutrix sp. 5H-3-7-4]AEG99877.1 hypothetical protein Lacal_0025 [Lacinutrix sp. 5H-3-7-4]